MLLSCTSRCGSSPCQAEPSWGMLDIFVVKRLQSVMALDALRSSHPVSVPIPDPAIINQIFDIITYDKGTDDGAESVLGSLGSLGQQNLVYTFF